MTYLANEGVRIEGGTCDVLIDALMRDSLGDYARHDPDVQRRLEAATATARIPGAWVCRQRGESRAF